MLKVKVWHKMLDHEHYTKLNFFVSPREGCSITWPEKSTSQVLSFYDCSVSVKPS